MLKSILFLQNSNMPKLDSLSQCISEMNKVSDSSVSLLSQVDIDSEIISDSLFDVNRIESFTDFLTGLNNHLEAISQSLATPVTVWGMQEGLARILIPSLVSLLVFFSGVMINVISNKSRVKSFKKTVLFWCEQMSETIKNQEEDFDSFSKELASKAIFQSTVLRKHELPIEPLSKISLEKFIHAFNWSTKVKRVVLAEANGKSDIPKQSADYYCHGLFSQITLLDEAHKQAFTEYNQYLDLFNQYRLEWNEAFNELKELIDSIIAQNNDKQANILRKILTEFLNVSGQDIDINVYQTKFIMPVNTWASQNLGDKSYGSQSSSIRSCVSKLLQIIYLFQSTNQVFSMRFKSFSSLYKQSKDSFRNAIDYYNNKTKTKFFVRSF